MSELTIQQSSRHAVYVQRFAGHLANEFDPYLENLKRELKIIMIDAPEETTNIRVINKLISDYKKASLIVYSDYNDNVLIKELTEFAGDEAGWQAAALDKAVDSPSVVLSTPSAAQAWAGVVAEPLVFPDSNGVKLLNPFIKDWEQVQIQKVSDIIRTGFVTGRTNNQITQDIAGKGGYLQNQNRKSIKSMVRTATTHTSNLARQATFDANDDVILGYEWVSTLDGRTSSTCKGLDGQVFKNKDTNKRFPPAHPNCRSSTAPVLDARYNLDDSVNTRASRGSEGGQQVNADLTYYQWLKDQGAQGPKGRAFVLDTLGNERGKLFLDGGLSADKFKQLTLDELFQPIPLDKLRGKQSLQLAFDQIGGKG
jgi:SPP1 gp7 family putative phage head morphogenesis protein